MKTPTSILSIILAPCTLLALGSCTNYRTPEANSAATGGLIGAGVGAAVADDPLTGAAVGGATGAGAGYLYGSTR